MDYLTSTLIRLTSWLQQTIQGSSSSSSSSATADVVVQELRKLEETLMRIRAFLRDAEEREVRDESVKLWLRELKTISYQADDLLDEYQYELLRCQVEERNIAAEAARGSNSGKRKSTAARISGKKRKSAGDDEILDLSNLGGDNFPNTIGNLINLQYLKSGRFDRFPGSICDLINLQYFEFGESDFP
ncbi:hypothetical protein J5N97_001707 [Dioscorea zingiberensis]|uniref:Disease resistance N-terminal domain-containing protein n=1 Tax=Dioscorea zingiberensis TaxID=325984 RepID=A0A9D5H344_9LILI|nr:hypothetical protein J5N97_001707 [Dioscorea zingiberensis]